MIVFVASKDDQRKIKQLGFFNKFEAFRLFAIMFGLKL